MAKPKVGSGRVLHGDPPPPLTKTDTEWLGPQKKKMKRKWKKQKKRKKRKKRKRMKKKKKRRASERDTVGVSKQGRWMLKLYTTRPTKCSELQVLLLRGQVRDT